MVERTVPVLAEAAVLVLVLEEEGKKVTVSLDFFASWYWSMVSPLPLPVVLESFLCLAFARACVPVEKKAHPHIHLKKETRTILTVRVDWRPPDSYVVLCSFEYLAPIVLEKGSFEQCLSQVRLSFFPKGQLEVDRPLGLLPQQLLERQERQPLQRRELLPFEVAYRHVWQVWKYLTIRHLLIFFHSVL